MSEPSIVPTIRHRKPKTPAALRALDAPIARETNPHGECVSLGKVISWSPMFYIVAFTEFGIVSTQYISKDRVHLTPCKDCPRPGSSAFSNCD